MTRRFFFSSVLALGAASLAAGCGGEADKKPKDKEKEKKKSPISDLPK